MKQKKKQPEVRPELRTPSPSNDLAIYAGLLAVIAAIYARALTFDFINYGDPPAVSENPHLLSGFGQGAIWALTSIRDGWSPLTRLSHLIDTQLFGLQGGLHHLLNVLLHAAATLFLFDLFKRATGSRWASAFVALAFAAHPLQAGHVAWVADRGIVLAGFFSILALWTYVRAGRIGPPAIAAVACALLSSPAAAMVAVLFPLLDLWPLRKTSRDPAWIVIAVMSIVAVAVAFAGRTAWNPGLFRQGLAQTIDAVWKFVIPVNVSFSDPSASPWAFLPVGGMLLMFVTAGAVRMLKTRPEIGAGWLWFLALCIPFAANSYLAIVGLAMLLAWSSETVPVRIRSAVAIVFCLIWTGTAWIAAGNWQNSSTLFGTSRTAFAYERLGSAQRSEGRVSEALANFATASKIAPADASVESSWGAALSAMGRRREAMAHLTKAVALAPDSPKAHVNLGFGLLRERNDGAAAEFRKALALDTDSTDARLGLGLALPGQEGANLAEAQKYYSDLARLAPENGRAHFELGRIAAATGKLDDAVVEFSSAVRLLPDDAEAHLALGDALAAKGRLDEAFNETSTAVRQQPQDWRALAHLADLLSKTGRPMEAMDRLEDALKADPEAPGVRDALDAVRRRLYGN